MASPDINTLIQSLYGGTIPQSMMAAPMTAQNPAAPSMNDLIGQITGSQQMPSAAPTTNAAGLMSNMGSPNISDQLLRMMSSVKLNTAPQEILPSAGALNQQQIPSPFSQQGQGNG